ncbi:peptide/nickel transport system permease protein [Actinacidiphila alni]|uniref:Peptide/nickel transport system permease protein n=1 Tax=Actinacidiphila alni TaxID=380248 RepID=A0A1I2HP91_9ACTN|nr:peptide/nickel transport system permease protein [Actinacidiphila alni]
MGGVTLSPAVSKAPAAVRRTSRSAVRRIWGSVLLKRIAFYLVAAWAAATLNFLLPRLMPGDPASAILLKMSELGPVTPDRVQLVHRLFGGAHSEPLWRQYFSYLGGLFHGDFGLSLAFYPTPVSTVVRSGFLWSVLLLGVSTVIAFVLGTVLGALAGRRPGGWLDTVISPLSIFVHSLPYFWAALILVYVFAFRLDWFPLSGGARPDLAPGFDPRFISSAVTHALLPAATIVLTSISGWLIHMRNMMASVVNEDYVLLARAKGLSETRVTTAYAARNAVLPSVSSFAVSIGLVVGGSLLTEMVFNYPGLGSLLNQAILNLDYPLMQALFLVISMTVLVANFVMDCLYVLLDPRTREAAS